MQYDLNPSTSLTRPFSIATSGLGALGRQLQSEYLRHRKHLRAYLAKRGEVLVGWDDAEETTVYQDFKVD